MNTEELKQDLIRLRSLGTDKWKRIEEIDGGRAYISNIRRIGVICGAVARSIPVKKSKFGWWYFDLYQERHNADEYYQKYWEKPKIEKDRKKEKEEKLKEFKKRSLAMADTYDFLTSEEKSHLAKSLYEAMVWGEEN